MDILLPFEYLSVITDGGKKNEQKYHHKWQVQVKAH